MGSVKDALHGPCLPNERQIKWKLKTLSQFPQCPTPTNTVYFLISQFFTRFSLGNSFLISSFLMLLTTFPAPVLAPVYSAPFTPPSVFTLFFPR